MRPVQFAPFITPACTSLVCRNPLPKAIKPKLVQKAGCGNESPGIQRVFAGMGSAKRRHWSPLPQALSSPQSHWHPQHSTECPFPALKRYKLSSPTRVSFCLHLKATAHGSLGAEPTDTERLTRSAWFFSLQAFSRLGCLLWLWKERLNPKLQPVLVPSHQL